MPGSKAAQKQARVIEKSQLRNKSVRSLCKTNIIKAEGFIFTGEFELAKQAVVVAISSLDKAAKKGVIKPNNAARHKSRLFKKLNEALLSAKTEPAEAE